MVSAISDNGGRSCINASAVVVPATRRRNRRRAGARNSARRAPARQRTKTPGWPASPIRKWPSSLTPALKKGLKTPGATDVTAAFRNGPRKVQFEGATYLRPTIVLCESFAHPLANREFLFPYASVVTVPQAEMLRQIGPSLAVTAITRDRAFIDQLLESPLVERLNLGPISTLNPAWDQPHEGNLFEFLYKRRSLDIAE